MGLRRITRRGAVRALAWFRQELASRMAADRDDVCGSAAEAHLSRTGPSLGLVGGQDRFSWRMVPRAKRERDGQKGGDELLFLPQGGIHMCGEKRQSWAGLGS
jgi:hypothetical protein